MRDAATQGLFDRTEGKVWITDGGLETALIFLDGIELPQFASFPLLEHEPGRGALRRYFAAMLDIAAANRTGFVLDTATWRASHGWGDAMALSADQIDAANRAAVAFARSLRDGAPGQEILVNGVIGPHGDAYAPEQVLTADQAQAYHDRQVRVLATEGVDLISAMTISSTGEAIGIARAARAAGIPVVLSFTVETDGRLISGQTLADAIAETDAATGGYPAWYGINCAHPDHFRDVLTGDWTRRIGSLRANASRKSHAELDEAVELDAGDPAELGAQYAALRAHLPGLRVVGGCCGTDARHIGAIGHACSHAADSTA